MADATGAQTHGRDELLHVQIEGGSQEELPHVQIRRGSQEDLPYFQGKEQRLHFAGAAVKR